MSKDNLWYMKESRQGYTEGVLKKKLEELENNLNLGEEEFKDLNKAQLIQKISTIGEIINLLNKLIIECEKDEEEYRFKLDNYTMYEQELQDLLDSFDRRKHNETQDAQSWNEFKEEEQRNDGKEENEDSEER